MKSIFILSFVSTMLFSGCGISFSNNVMNVDEDVFFETCDFDFVDNQHFVYKEMRPSVIFIYSDIVEHCRRQSEIFNETADMYSDKILFWAIDEQNASKLHEKFKTSEKLPVYLFINQNIAHKLSIDHISVELLEECFQEHFGVTPILQN